MIFLIHRNATEFLRAIKSGEEVTLKSSSITLAFWELAKSHQEDILVWVEEKLYKSLNKEYFQDLFLHKNMMASYAITTRYLPDKIGYVDQLPFVNPDRNVKYPSWLMSTDVGGLYGETALKFRNDFTDIKNFGYLLNSIAKLGQQNSLFCYSDPDLVKIERSNSIQFQASKSEFFDFVAQHYKQEWLWVLLFCLMKYKKDFPIRAFLSSKSKKPFFQKRIELSTINHLEGIIAQGGIDVVIPSLGRPGYVKQVLRDLSGQTKLPKKVIIIEQNPEPSSKTEFNFLEGNWPFDIVHHFIHKTGACNARNLAMKEISSEFIFFADDDIRLPEDLLEKSLKELVRLKVNAINMACLQPGEEPIFKKIKQWGAFGSGTSIVNSTYALQCRFSEIYELGFGEDIDFGMQLRSKGCDIIYHPELIFTHLKADRGGFRSTGINEWSDKEIEPKPSPTMMYLVNKYYTSEMIRGYKVSLYLKFFRKQAIRNPFRYFKKMEKRWKRSEELCNELQTNKAL